MFEPFFLTTSTYSPYNQGRIVRYFLICLPRATICGQPVRRGHVKSALEITTITLRHEIDDTSSSVPGPKPCSAMSSCVRHHIVYSDQQGVAYITSRTSRISQTTTTTTELITAVQAVSNKSRKVKKQQSPRKHALLGKPDTDQR